MPPKIRITKESIIEIAVEIVREQGEQGINARNLASVLKCSTQPIFSNFATMEELKMSMVDKVNMLCEEYIQKEVAKGEYPAYKASGMAYIRFAKEEKALFKLLYMRDRTEETYPAELELSNQMENILRNTTGLEDDDMKLFHLEMWAYVHGIASMCATGFVDLNWDLISKMLTDAYMGLRKQYTKE